MSGRTGEWIPSKFIWLLDNVELVGTVFKIAVRPTDGGPGDDFQIVPDANYQHLIRYFRGNNPLQWEPRSAPGMMHLETYPLTSATGSINRWEPWTLPRKPDNDPFMVKLRDGTLRALRVGDRVRVTGRWVIDHHPENCYLPTTFTPPEATRCRNRFFARVGQTHTELHPFNWADIRLVESLRSNDLSTCRVSMAAPLYEEQYLPSWFANKVEGVDGRVFIEESVTSAGTITNFNTMVGTRVTVPAPPLPDIPASSYRRLMWNESVMKLGQGMNIDDVRTVTPTGRSIDVQVSVIASTDDGRRPTVQGPALDRWIAQIEYSVYWALAGNEISCITRGPGGGGFPPADGPMIAVGGSFPNGDRWWLRLGEAVAAAQNGHRFYIQPLFGSPIDVVVVGTGNKATLSTNQRGRPDPLLSLPPCPNPPIIT